MDNHKLEIKVSLKIQKPLHEVFEAIADPEKMSNYFISYSSGKIEEDQTLIWKFPEFDMEFPIRVTKVEMDRYISFFWNDFDGTETNVEISLYPKEDESTFVTVTEKSRPNDVDGIKWLQGNTEGWANVLACMKAWLEYGIHLRKGAFVLSQMPEKK